MAEQFGSNPWPTPPSLRLEGPGQPQGPTQPHTASFAPTILRQPPSPTNVLTRNAADPFLLADVTTQPLQRVRTWPALLTLYLLAPICGEVISGSTPPLQFINPIALFALAGLYGSGAIVARELVRRRGLRWPSLLLFGAAYGILEEGLVVTSWFNPKWPDLGFLAYYGRLFDTSWVWATQLTVYHAIVSIMVPILLTEVLFPRIANRPWLGKRGFIGICAWLAVVSLLEGLFFILVAIHNKGYAHPPLMYIGAILLAIGFVLWGLRLRPRKPPDLSARVVSSRPAPSLWGLRLAGFGGIFAIFFLAWVLPKLTPIPVLPILVMLATVGLGIWAVSRWTKRVDWSISHRLALISGVLSFFIAFSPLAEFVIHPIGRITTGMTLFDVVILVGLVFLTWRLRRERLQRASPVQSSQ